MVRERLMEALERACIMASTGDVRGQGLAHVVMDSLKQPGLYTFDRLLRVRQIDEVCRASCRHITRRFGT